MKILALDLWKKHMRHPEASEIASKDIISHFVLRLVCCRTDELSKWFLSMEASLFHYRVRCESSEAQRALTTEIDLLCKAVNNAEFEGLKDKLGQAAHSIGQPLPTGKKRLFLVCLVVWFDLQFFMISQAYNIQITPEYNLF